MQRSASDDKVRLELHDYQGKWLADTSQRKIWLASRQIGKSLALALEAVVEAFERPGTLNLMLSASERQSQELMKKASRMLEYLRMCSGGLLRAVADEARRLAPVRTGRLRASIQSQIDGPLAGRVVVGAPHARYVLSGTGVFGPSGRPISIGPRKEKALVWPGAAHPVRRVSIRGMRPNDFLSEALRRVDIAAAFKRGTDGETV